jgi:hypothetical protein
MAINEGRMQQPLRPPDGQHFPMVLVETGLSRHFESSAYIFMALGAVTLLGRNG